MQYHLHCAWKPQSSCKAEGANNKLKTHLHKLSQKTGLPKTTLLFTVLLRKRISPHYSGLSSFEMPNRSPFLTNDFSLDLKVTASVKHITFLFYFQRALQQNTETQPRKNKSLFFIWEV